MFNNTSNELSDDISNTSYFIGRDNALFLTILLITTGINLLITAAVIMERKTNLSVRVILINLLLSGVVSSIAIFVYDISVILEGYDSTTVWWQAVVVLFYFGGTGRVLFATMYAVAVLLLVVFWDRRITKPSNTKYFIITAVVVWIAAFVSASPLISKDITFEKPAESCDCYPYSTGFVLLHSILFSILPAIASLIILLVTLCYRRYKTLDDEGDDKILRGLLRFGFFLLVVQAFNVAAHVLLPIMYINLLNELFDDTYFSFRSVFDAIHLTLIPTPVLVLIFFKPARDTLTNWLTCSFLRKKCTTSTSSVTGNSYA